MTPAVVVDVGNTRIKWGRCSHGSVVAMCAVPPDDPSAWAAQYQAWNLNAEGTWVIAGVHPERQDSFVRWLKQGRCHQWMLIQSREQVPIRVSVDYPDKVGLDRLFDAAAVNSRRPPGQPAVIVDAGSAVTVDYVAADGTFLGGAILPGPHLMAKALNSFTAKLPIVTVQRRLRAPETSTERAIELGIFHAVLGGIEGVIRDLETRAGQSLPLFFGGGDAPLFAAHLARPSTLWPEMTLEGIRLAGAHCP